MISYLAGKVRHRGDRSLVLEVGGVGYLVHVPDSLLYAAKEGDELEVFTHLYVRETAMELYGLSSLAELDFFQQLISVSGVGPKSALGVLSVAKLEDIKAAILRGEPSFLTKVSGIGKKTAERLIVELRGKIAKEGDYGVSDAALGSGDGDVIDALVGLGYKAADARDVARRIPEDAEGVEDRIREALKILGKS